MVNFDHFRLHLLLANLFAQNIHYERAKGRGKVNKIDSTEPSDLNGAGLDCSGFVNYIIRKSSPEFTFPKGSSTQRSWCDDRFERIDYVKNAPLIDNHVRIGFRKTIPGRIITPKTATTRAIRGKKLQVGHVWLVINGQTYESTTKSGNNGPASLSWSDRTADADFFYTLGPVPAFQALCLLTPIK